MPSYEKENPTKSALSSKGFNPVVSVSKLQNFVSLRFSNNKYLHDYYNTIILFITLTIVFLSLTIGLLLFKKRWFVNCSFAFAISFLVNPLIMIGLIFLNNSTSYTNQFSNYKKFDNCVNNLVDLEFFYDDINDDEVITYHYFVEEDSDRNIEISY